MRIPDYRGGGLVNLVAEMERRLGGEAASPGLEAPLAAALPEADTYVFLLFDGLGDRQLEAHPGGARLRRHRIGGLDTSFSSQTSVATATVASGLPPSRHGLLSYALRLGESPPVNTLWWFDTEGNPPELDLDAFLPAPNLAERLGRRGVDAVVVEPLAYLGSPLDRVLYRGAEKRGVGDGSTIVEAILDEASRPHRLVVGYLPDVDAAGHAMGTGSSEYAAALTRVSDIWDWVGERLPDGVALVGTADHGMVDIVPGGHVELDPPPGLTLSGDSRVVYVHGDPPAGEDFASGLPGTWVGTEEAGGLWGPGPFHPEYEKRLPAGLIFAVPGIGFLYPGNSIPLAAFHGGLTEDELRIPLLVWDG